MNTAPLAPNHHKWLTIDEAAAYARVSRRTIMLWLDKTLVRTTKLPSGRRRIWADDLLPEQPAEKGAAL